MQAATRHAMEKARGNGLAWGIVRETTHTGPMGYYAAQIANAGMLALVASSSRPLMAYFGARKAGVATSPVAMAAPGDRFDVVMLDMATAEIAIGKILNARATGEPIPPGSALTAEGEPTTNPLEAAVPLPLAGPKGSGLALMLECFQGVLVDHPLLAPALRGEPVVHSQNGLVAAIDIGLFGDAASCRKRVDELGEAIKGLPRAAGVRGDLSAGRDRARDSRRTSTRRDPAAHEHLERAAADSAGGRCRTAGNQGCANPVMSQR